MNRQDGILQLVDVEQLSKVHATKPIKQGGKIMFNAPIDEGKSMANENFKTAYQELCTSYHAVDDFRAKLLGLLPFATGAGIFLLVTEKEKLEFAQQFLFPIGADALKVNGQFKRRPREVFYFINEPFAAGIIYPAVLAAWTFLAMVFTWPQYAQSWATGVFICGFFGLFYFNFWLKLKGEAEGKLGLEEREASIGDVIAYLKIKHARLPETEKNIKMSELKIRLQPPGLCPEQATT